MENINTLESQTEQILKMKEIIYLDKNIINSFLAQIYDGLNTSTNRETGEEVKSGSESEEGYKRGNSFEVNANTGKGKFIGVFEGPSGDVKFRIQPGAFESEKTNLYQTETGKEIITRQLHDNSLLQFEDYMISNNLIKHHTEEFNVGDYIKIKGYFKLFDFKFITKVIESLDILHNINVEQSIQTISNVLNELDSKSKNLSHHQNKSTQTKFLAQTEQKRIKDKTKQEKNSFDNIKKLLESTTALFSDKVFMTLNGFLLPLKEEFLREKAPDLMFNYDGVGEGIEIVVVGKITRKINNETSLNFETLHSIVNMSEFLLVGIDVAKKGDFIVSPIAVYFE